MKLEDKMNHVPDEVSALAEAAVEWTRHNPWKALGAAIAAGIATRSLVKHYPNLPKLALTKAAAFVGPVALVKTGLEMVGGIPLANWSARSEPAGESSQPN